MRHFAAFLSPFIGLLREESLSPDPPDSIYRQSIVIILTDDEMLGTVLDLVG